VAVEDAHTLSVAASLRLSAAGRNATDAADSLIWYICTASA
jgi:hypothetical protein